MQEESWANRITQRLTDCEEKSTYELVCKIKLT
jgi:hypothetical protein